MIVYGKQVFFYLLQRHKELINELYLAKECDRAIFSQVAKSGFRIKKLDFKAAQSYARGGNHQGFLMDIKEIHFASLMELKKGKFLAMLWGLSDMGNMGAIVRTAYALGVDGLIFIARRLNMETLIRTSSGAAASLPIALLEDGFSAINELKQVGFKLYGADSQGRDIRNFQENVDKKVLIVGSEGEGLSQKVIKKCDDCLGIVMQNDFDSLNVNAAFAILCDRMMYAKL